jgi:hypothetical protein
VGRGLFLRAACPDLVSAVPGLPETPFLETRPHWRLPNLRFRGYTAT